MVELMWSVIKLCNKTFLGVYFQWMIFWAPKVFLGISLHLPLICQTDVTNKQCCPKLTSLVEPTDSSHSDHTFQWNKHMNSLLTLSLHFKLRQYFNIEKITHLFFKYQWYLRFVLQQFFFFNFSNFSFQIQDSMVKVVWMHVSWTHVRIKQSVTGSPAPLTDISVTVRTVTTDSTANTGTHSYTPKPCTNTH